MPCDLGHIDFAYRSDHPLLPILATHGVEIIDGEYEQGCGVIDAHTDTLVEVSSGMGLTTGMQIRHTADACARGLARARS